MTLHGRSEYLLKE
ncbi:Protein of unknown function [Bacillus cereus]|nr:Protein of unknown function [Bacillus mobilis]SCM93531.1 Protein of unknown function [Bacillus cereus]